MAEIRGNIFRDFFGRKTKTRNVTKRTATRPYNRDATGGDVADGERLDGLYYGTDPGLQFAAPLAFTPVAVPVALIAVPTPITKDENTKEALSKIIADKADEFPMIERTKLVKGTAWRWVRYDARTMTLVWESIPDESIVDIETDPSTDEIVTVWTHDNFKITVGENQTGYVERKRKITRKNITVTWVRREGLAKDLQDTTSVNPFGFMPIPFGHDCPEGKWRGMSVYTRIMRTLKSSHDIEINRDEVLSQFRPKIIHEVDDVDEWLENNGYGTSVVDCENDAFESRMFLNLFGKEKTSFISIPADATSQHTAAMADAMKRAIIGSGIPELFWGTLATGNAASTDTQRDMAVQFMNSLRREDNSPYEKIFNQSLVIMGFIDLRSYTNVKMAWNDLDMVSADVKATILQKVSQAIGMMVTTANGTKEDMLYFWKQFYPNLPEKDQAEFDAGIVKTAEHKALSNIDAMTLQELNGTIEPETDGDE